MKQNKETEQTTMDVADEKDTSRERKRFPVNIHMILLSAIVLIIGFSAFRLYLWDKGGERIEYDPNQQTTDFDVEVLDSIIPLAPDKREGYVDDGVTTILCLGDDPFSLDQGEGGLVLRLIQDQTDMHKLSPPWEGLFVVSKNLHNRSYYLIDVREHKDSRKSEEEETQRPWNIAHLWPYYT